MTQRVFWLLMATLLLAACEKDKIPLSGERKPILSSPTVVVNESGTIEANLSPGTRNTDWDQAGFTATHMIPHLALGETLHHAWTANIGQGSSEEQRLIANVISHGGRIYGVDAGGQLACIDVKTGQMLWHRTTAPTESPIENMGGGLAYENGQLLVTTARGDVIAFDEQGQEIWRQNVQTPIRTAPTVKDGRVFVLTVSNELFALDVKSGARLWNHGGIPENAGILGGSSPAVKDGIVVFAYSSGEVGALSVDSGAMLWSDTITPSSHMEALSAIPHIRARPVIAGDKVYIVSHGGRTVGFDLKSGIRLWQQDIGGIRTPAVMGDYLVLVNSQDDLICLNRHTGKIAWSSPLPHSTDKKNRLIWAGPVLAGNHLIVAGSNGEILFIAPRDGQKAKSLVVEGGAFFLSPIVVDGTLLAIGDNGDLVAWR